MSVNAVRKDAELVVDVCMSVEQDDVVTIITDDEHDDQAHVVAEVCVDRGAWPVIMNNEMQVRRGLANTRFPMAPPRNLHEAMVNSGTLTKHDRLELIEGFLVAKTKKSPPNSVVCELSRSVLGRLVSDKGWYARSGAPVRIPSRSSEPAVTAPDSPYIVSFAMRTASSSSSYGMTTSTGPKISSWAIVERASTSANSVGST